MKVLICSLYQELEVHRVYKYIYILDGIKHLSNSFSV